MLLSRVAESLYWAARYLERSEDTARILREHTNLFMDLPATIPVSWDPLLSITGSREDFDDRYNHTDEATVLAFLVRDLANGSSIASSVMQARENLRSVREMIPRDAWHAVNDLHLYVVAQADAGVARRSRTRFLDRIIEGHRLTLGVMMGDMNRDSAFTMLRLGRLLERADMTTRVLDVRAASLMEATTEEHFYADIQWAGMLRSLSALQMYHRTGNREVVDASAVDFVLHEGQFPRSVRYGLSQVQSMIAGLPRSELVLPACTAAQLVLDAIDPKTLDAEGVHRAADDLQIALADIHDAVASTYFLAADFGLAE